MKKVIIEDNKNNIIKKHNDLIRKARYSLSETGIKVVSTLISMIRADDKDFQEYHFNINDFKELIGSNSKEVSRYVDVMTDELMSKPFKIDNYKFNWCYLAHYKEGDNTVMFKIAPELKPYLLELQKNFTQINIKDILLLKSAYVIRFYEHCIMEWQQYKAYNKQANKYTFELEIETLRELFEIPDSYLYKDIRVNIIDKAVKQFEEKTNIKIEYKEQKLGKKVVRLQITVKDNVQGSNDVLRSRQAFIAYVRKAYKPDLNKNFFPVVVSTTKGDLKVSKDGLIYNNALEAEYTREQADKLWNWLYDECIKRGDLSLLADPEQKGLF